MGDLYGDLPPLGTEGEQQQLPIIGSSWSSLQPKVDRPVIGVNAGIAASTTVSVDTTAAAAQPTTKAKLVPSSLLFRPRQTSVPSSSSGSSTISKVALTSAAPSTQRVLSETAVADVELTTKNDEFNTSAVFDVEDAYDPSRPNDYSKFCAERVEKKRLFALAEENSRQLQEQERNRVAVSEQRNEILSRGDLHQLIANVNDSASAAGRGRGRGLSNLPHWVTQRIEDSNLPNNISNESAATQANAFNNASKDDQSSNRSESVHRPTKVVRMCNMTSERDADQSLADETRAECERFGRVLSVRLLVLPVAEYPRLDDSLRVQLFVEFSDQMSSIKALKELDKRFFGGRQVQANFFDEKRYHNSDLIDENVKQSKKR